MIRGLGHVGSPEQFTRLPAPAGWGILVRDGRDGDPGRLTTSGTPEADSCVHLVFASSGQDSIPSGQDAIYGCMTGKAPKRPKDANQLAKAIVDIATGHADESVPTTQERAKDPAAVSLGRRGGLKGGRARADKLDPKTRREIAQRAAHARWSKDDDSGNGDPQ